MIKVLRSLRLIIIIPTHEDNSLFNICCADTVMAPVPAPWNARVLVMVSGIFL